MGAETRTLRVEPLASPAPPDESLYLRHLLEKQPSCLLRVGRDGTLLACNDAGLSLLGKTELAQVLNRPFQDHLSTEHADAWLDFGNRVWTSGAGSFECELLSPDAGSRTVLLQAIALPNHPDSIESLLVSVRD